MIYEIKKYTAHPGKAKALSDRFVAKTLPLFRKNGITVIAAFAPESAPDELWYVTAFQDEAARSSAWAAFGADAEWKAVKASSEVEGPLLATQSTEVLHSLAGAPGVGA